jgi:hypothetical protein
MRNCIFDCKLRRYTYEKKSDKLYFIDSHKIIVIFNCSYFWIWILSVNQKCVIRIRGGIIIIKHYNHCRISFEIKLKNSIMLYSKRNSSSKISLLYVDICIQ